MNDWSNLTTVNYVGGHCGNFIAVLIDKALNNNSSYFTSDRNRYFYDCPFDKKLLGLTYILVDEQFHHTLGFLDQFPSDSKVVEGFAKDNLLSPYLGYDVKKIVYDADKQTMIENLSLFAEQIVGANKNKKIVSSFHNVNKHSVGLSQIFPQSTNILLTSSSIDKYMMFRLLHWYKTVEGYGVSVDGDKVNVKGGSTTIDQIINSFFTLQHYNTNYHNEIPIDVFSIVFDLQTDQLSSLLNIQVDQEFIKEYKDQNVEIINRIFDIDPFSSYSENEIKNKLYQRLLTLDKNNG